MMGMLKSVLTIVFSHASDNSSLVWNLQKSLGTFQKLEESM
jgi:hypothetical protein